MDLHTLRGHIDALDDRLLTILQERACLIHDVVQAKHAAGIPTHAADREAEMFSRLRARATALGLDPDYVHELWSLIIVHTKEIECAILGTTTPFPQTRPPDDELRRNLLTLTERVAPAYHEYCAGETSAAIHFYLSWERRRLMETIKSLSIRRERALDLGCATGEATELLESSFVSISAYDLSPHIIEVARSRRPWSPHVTLAVQDVLDILPAVQGDATFILANFGTASEFPPDTFLPAVARALAPGGRAFLSFHNAAALSVAWYHPWPSTLHARLNALNDTLEVWVGAEAFTIPGWGMTTVRLGELARSAGLWITSLETYPTVLSILPQFFFRSPRFRTAVSIARGLDEALAERPPHVGTYLLAVLEKPSQGQEGSTRPGGWSEGVIQTHTGPGFGDHR